VHEVAPYPNISCVFEDGIGGGPPSVPLDSIADVKQFVTYYGNGTFRYEMTSNVSVSYNTSLSCTFISSNEIFRAVLLHFA
jgi:hypothetical protein